MAKNKRKQRRPDRRGGQGLDRSKRVSLRKADSYVKMAQRAWQQQQFAHAFTCYEEALRRDPTNTDVMIDLARAYGLRQDFATAEQYVERALRSDPKRARLQYLAGKTYWMINRPDEAARCFGRVLELNPQSPDGPAALVSLAHYYERHHRLEDAEQTLERALTLDTTHAEAKLSQAVLLRRQGKTERAVARLRELLGQDDLPFQVESDSWYELGQLFDTQGDYAAAVDALVRAKKILIPHGGKFREQWNSVRQRNDRMLATLTADHFSRWHDMGPAEPPLRWTLLTGHPRSGTTLIEQVLDGHPDLVSADEFTTFSDWVFTPLGQQFPPTTTIPSMLDDTTTAAIRSARKEYWSRTEAMLDQPLAGRMLMDKNPELTYLVPVANRVFPEMKILFALRDPRDVVLSCFMQKLGLNSVSVNYLTLADTVVKYAHVMRTWLTIRPWLRSDWIEFRYEDTIADLPSQAKRLLEFLQLDWDGRVLDFHAHAQQKMIRSPTYEAVTSPIHHKSAGRWRNYEKFLQPFAEQLEPYISEFGYA